MAEPALVSKLARTIQANRLAEARLSGSARKAALQDRSQAGLLGLPLARTFFSFLNRRGGFNRALSSLDGLINYWFGDKTIPNALAN